MRDCNIAGIYPAMMASGEAKIETAGTTIDFGTIESGSRVKEIWRFVKALVHQMILKKAEQDIKQ